MERMIALTDQLRRLKVDYYEYIALKVIILLSSSGGECPGAGGVAGVKLRPRPAQILTPVAGPASSRRRGYGLGYPGIRSD